MVEGVQKTDLKISPHFWARRLHSLSGVFPLGAFLIEHMLSNAFVVKGPEAYNAVIATLSGLPYVLALEITFIYLPLLYHAFYGFYVMGTGKNNLIWYPYPGNFLYTLQRWTGILAFIYIAYHFYHTRGVNLLYGTEVSYERMQMLLSDPKMFWFYIFGLAAVMFHFGNGLWGFLISWGVLQGKGARRFGGLVCALVGVVLFFIGVQSVLHLAG